MPNPEYLYYSPLCYVIITFINSTNLLILFMKIIHLSTLFLIISLFVCSCSDDISNGEDLKSQVNSKSIDGLIDYAKKQYGLESSLKSLSNNSLQQEPQWSDYEVFRQSIDSLALSIPVSTGSDGVRTVLVATQVEAKRRIFLVKTAGSANDSLPMNIRRRIVLYKDGEKILCRPIVGKDGKLRLARLRDNSSMLKAGGIDDPINLPEVVVYPSSFDYEEDWWWWDYMSGIISIPPPPYYGGYSGDDNKGEPDRPDYFKADNVTKSPEVKEAMKTLLNNVKNDASKDKGRRERGIWVFYEPKEKKYYTGKEIEGKYVKGIGSKGSVWPGVPGASKSDDIPKTAVPVTFIHSHTPLTYEEDGRREVGPSKGDRDYADEQKIEIIVIDYVGSYDEDDGKRYIYNGHNINDSTKEYIYTPKK